jgi:hypothetical protein
MDVDAPLVRPTPPTPVVKPNSSASGASKGRPDSARNNVSTENDVPLAVDNASRNVDSQVPNNDIQPIASSSKPPAQDRIDEAGEESVTEPDDDEPIPLPATQGTKPKPVRVQSSESDSEPPPKKKKVMPKQEALSSTDDSDDESGRHKNAAVATKKRAPVRQPVKRGGKKW